MKLKREILLILFYCIVFQVQAQKISTESNEPPDTLASDQRFHSLYDISTRYYQTGNSDSMLYYTKALINCAQALNNDSFLVVSYRILGNCYYLKNDHVSAIRNYFKGIKIAEDKPGTFAQLPQLYNNIGFNYNKLGYHESALKYLRKAEVAASRNIGKLSSLAYIYENLSETFLGMNVPDSAVKYLRLADTANLKSKEKYIQASIILDYGMTYAQLFYQDLSPKYLKLAEESFRRAIEFSDKAGDYKHLANSLTEYAVFFQRQSKLNTAESVSKLDSSRNYALRSLAIAERFKYTDNIIKNADLLRMLYKAAGNEHKAYIYLTRKNDESDSLLKLNEENQLLSLTFDEQFREKELEAKAAEAELQRHRYIEISLIAIILISLIIAFLLLSRSFIVNEKFIMFSGQIGLLIVFEFINLVLHPFIEQVTHHATILMLLILVSLAALLIPIHHRLEKYVKIKLVEKNRSIRKSIAKKILEGAQSPGEEDMQKKSPN